MADKKCEHPHLHADVEVKPVEEGGGRSIVEMRIECSGCGMPFRFLGLPTGVDIHGAFVSDDRTEARLTVVPAEQYSVGGSSLAHPTVTEKSNTQK